MALGDAAKVASHEGNAGALHGHLGASAHGDSDFGFAESGGIVDAVASHRHVLSFRAQLLHLSDLPSWLDLRLYGIEAELPCHRSGSA